MQVTVIHGSAIYLTAISFCFDTHKWVYIDGVRLRNKFKFQFIFISLV